MAWKYQTGATELSFSGYYQDVHHTWDKNGLRKPNTTVEDSLYFVNTKKLNAKDYILEQSKNTDIIIINEAHHMAQHRIFTKSLLKDLYANGYRYLGLEALFETTINYRKYPVIESGYYTKEPEFGNLIAEALKLGFTLFNYEATPGKNGKEREIEQTESHIKTSHNFNTSLCEVSRLRSKKPTTTQVKNSTILINGLKETLKAVKMAIEESEEVVLKIINKNVYKL